MAGDHGPGSSKPLPAPSLNLTDHSDKKMPAMEMDLKKKLMSSQSQFHFQRRPAGRLKSGYSSSSDRSGNSTGAQRGGLIHKLRHDKSEGAMDQSSLTLATAASTKFHDSHLTLRVNLLDGSAKELTHLDASNQSMGMDMNHGSRPIEDNRNKQTNRFRTDASSGSVHSVDRPLQLPRPSYHRTPDAPYRNHGRRGGDLQVDRTSQWRDQRGYRNYPSGEYFGEDDRNYYPRQGDYHDPRDNYQYDRGRPPPRDYYERHPPRDYRHGDRGGYDDRYYQDRYDRRYEPSYDQGRSYECDPRYDDRYDPPRHSQDEGYRRDHRCNSRYYDRHEPRYERDFEPSSYRCREEDYGRGRREEGYRCREEDYDRNHSRRHEEPEYGRYEQDRYHSRRYDDYDDPGPVDRSEKSSHPIAEEDEDCLKPTQNSQKSCVRVKGRLKDDSAYDYDETQAVRRPGAFQATGTGRNKQDKLAASGMDDPMYIEVFPGTSERLRRTQETKEAVENDFITPAVCFACDTDIFCIADVKYYICPNCKCVSLLTEEGGSLRKFHGERRDVGIAFCYDTLFKMQSEIVREAAS